MGGCDDEVSRLSSRSTSQTSSIPDRSSDGRSSRRKHDVLPNTLARSAPALCSISHCPPVTTSSALSNETIGRHDADGHTSILRNDMPRRRASRLLRASRAFARERGTSGVGKRKGVLEGLLAGNNGGAETGTREGRGMSMGFSVSERLRFSRLGGNHAFDTSPTATTETSRTTSSSRRRTSWRRVIRARRGYALDCCMSADEAFAAMHVVLERELDGDVVYSRRRELRVRMPLIVNDVIVAIYHLVVRVESKPMGSRVIVRRSLSETFRLSGEQVEMFCEQVLLRFRRFCQLSTTVIVDHV